MGGKKQEQTGNAATFEKIFANGLIEGSEHCDHAASIRVATMHKVVRQTLISTLFLPTLTLHSCCLVDLAQRNSHVHFLFAAVDGDLHRVSGAMVVHDAAEVATVIDVLSVNGDD
ncbi:MAG: hypothetical protein JWO13_500 [Acidobacteriales bacterium]|nr:hypothetical protein [Terriglobales bacterium]